MRIEGIGRFPEKVGATIGEAQGRVKRRENIFQNPLPKKCVHLHNARPAEVQALIDAGGVLEAVSKAVDEFEACCKMRGPADGTASEEAVRDGGEAKKDCDTVLTESKLAVR